MEMIMPTVERALPVHATDRLLRLSQVIDIVGIGKTMIYRLVRENKFPQPFKPGGYASRWSEAEVQAWRESQRRSGVSNGD